jgi:adenosylhomocysteine nucleosidase
VDGLKEGELMETKIDVVVLISADIEWKVVRNFFPSIRVNLSPFGEYLRYPPELLTSNRQVILFNGGWGKISAAASTQYVIDRWKPKLLINLGTCGGFEGKIERGTLILVERTIVYDIYEQMGDLEAHITYYTTNLDLSWLRKPYPDEVVNTLLVSGDRDLNPEEVKGLNEKYGAGAGEWESGAIAYVANCNQMPCLILRGVSDLVSEIGGEAYGDISLFKDSANTIIAQLLKSLPEWIDRADVFTD